MSCTSCHRCRLGALWQQDAGEVMYRSSSSGDVAHISIGRCQRQDGCDHSGTRSQCRAAKRRENGLKPITIRRDRDQVLLLIVAPSDGFSARRRPDRLHRRRAFQRRASPQSRCCALPAMSGRPHLDRLHERQDPKAPRMGAEGRQRDGESAAVDARQPRRDRAAAAPPTSRSTRRRPEILSRVLTPPTRTSPNTSRPARSNIRSGTTAASTSASVPDLYRGTGEALEETHVEGDAPSSTRSTRPLPPRTSSATAS